MTTTVLRKTVGGYSAGTRVYVVPVGGARGMVRVQPWCAHPTDEPLEIPAGDIVLRRAKDGETKETRPL